MKKIFSSPIVGEIAQLRNMLESAGIGCILRNEVSAGLSPEVPLAESTPELWIQDDGRLAEALQIKTDFQTAVTAVGEDWQCQKCGEISETQFTSCWKCGALRSEHLPIKWMPHVQRAQEASTQGMVKESESPIFMTGKERFRWWIKAWGLALFVMGFLTLPFSFFFPQLLFWFPTGLLRLAGLRRDELNELALVAWAPYIMLTILAFRMPTRRGFHWCFFILCALLLVNIGGCVLCRTAAYNQTISQHTSDTLTMASPPTNF